MTIEYNSDNIVETGVECPSCNNGYKLYRVRESDHYVCPRCGCVKSALDLRKMYWQTPGVEAGFRPRKRK